MIQFLAPAFLFGIALIAIPILIHLFNFRRYKRVEFTNVRFLKNVQEQTSRTSRLKHLLVLLSRILAIVMLALAFAQPVIRHANADLVKAGDPVSIFVDNSFSMNAQGAKGALLDRAR
ncbi:MAG: BatA domain-containing protein, partial [Bacteroidota bacterium]